MSVLLSAHLRDLKTAGYSPRSIEDRRRLLDSLDRDRDHFPEGIDRASTDELAEWLDHDDWAPWTRWTYREHLVNFYRWEVSAGRLDWSPAEDLPRMRRPNQRRRPVTDDQLRQALERSDPWWRLAITLCAYEGLRAREAARLRREDVTADDLTVRGKGGRVDTLPTHPQVWRLVEPLPDGLLLPGRDGREVAKIPQRARHHFDRIGLPDVHLHKLRHWFATMLMRAGVDIETIRLLMRHEHLSSTAIYLHEVNGQRSNAIRTLPVLHGLDENASSQQNAA